MQSDVELREFRETDYDAVLALWKKSAGVEVAEGDDRKSVGRYLQRNAGLSRVAVKDGRIVGAVLCGHDGRRGVLYHLAVAREFQDQGIGRRIVTGCLTALREQGLERAIILVGKDNPSGRRFWRAAGFEEISGAIAFGCDLPE